ncbi:sulfite exporter TauE/SafE family protein [Terrimonas pollutisoli]|uniref:sulfite exporter TauE/SafE family protein n=1 Tax=Terrimonas pollutisoli TaxID=3034147 RepID=UPI0023EAEB13|nr:sulfite exporter TauE/SafE family protein [Terrimonas sp. H1YJ31]
MTAELVITILLIGLFAGILSGLVGVGGGLIIVPALIFFLGFTQHQAQGTSLGLLLLPVGILAVINYYNKGNVDIKVVAVMSIAFIAGGYLGSKLALRLPEDTVKKIFAVFLFYSAFKLLGWDKAIFNSIKELFK